MKRSGYTCYISAAYKASSAFSEVAADWHELIIPRRIMRPSTASDSEQLDPRCSTEDIPPPQSATLGFNPVARKLLLISRPAEGRMLRLPSRNVSLGLYIIADDT